MTAAALLKSGTTLLADSSQSARADAMRLLAHAIGRPREWIVAHPEPVIPEEAAQAFRAYCDRRRLGEPIAYIVGSAGFYGREFRVNEHVLIPRPETEHLVDEALAFLRQPMRVLDVGTGSGAIACTIAAETNVFADGTDLSEKALQIANENAMRLGVGDRVHFFYGDLIEPVRGKRYDVVIANLPYIPTDNLPQRPDPVSFEPRAALDGGPDGLTFYRRLLAGLTPLLNDSAMLLLECAPPTLIALKDLVRQHFPHFVIEEGKDYAGLLRYIKAQSPRSAELYAGAAASESARSQEGERAENRAQGRT